MLGGSCGELAFYGARRTPREVGTFLTGKHSINAPSIVPHACGKLISRCAKPHVLTRRWLFVRVMPRIVLALLISIVLAMVSLIAFAIEMLRDVE